MIEPSTGGAVTPEAEDTRTDELRRKLRMKLEQAIDGQGYGMPEQERDQAIEVAALASALVALHEIH